MPKVTVRVKGASRTVRYLKTCRDFSHFAEELIAEGIVSGFEFKDYEYILASKEVNISTLKAVAKKLGGEGR